MGKNERKFKGRGEKKEKPIKICVKMRTFFKWRSNSQRDNNDNFLEQ